MANVTPEDVSTLTRPTDGNLQFIFLNLVKHI
jgi:hypothetical protein